MFAHGVDLAASDIEAPPVPAQAEVKADKVNLEKAEEELSDAAITEKIEQMYAETPDLDFYDIQVETVDGVVHLSATVRYFKQRYRAIEMAESVPGVKSVDASKLYYFQIP